jgi:hypothetical protein
MTKDTDAKGVDRRSFFRGLSGAAAAGAVAGATLGGAPAQASENKDERAKARYRETDHVKTFYRTNRY